jgi:hypothetical protein
VIRIVADGAGHLTGSAIKSDNGTLKSDTLNGTYVIKSNCTGTATFTYVIGGNTDHVNFVLNSGNKGAFLIQTDAPRVQSSVAVALGSTIVCTDLAVKKKYSLRFTGVVLSTGQVALVGQVSLNGTGGITGTATRSLNGVITSLTLGGTYVINTDCTGTAQITSSMSPVNLSLLVVSIDKEILALETDSNTIVSGIFQQ